MRFSNLEKTAPKPILTAYKMPIFQSKAIKLLGCKVWCPAFTTVSQLNIRCIKVKVMEAQTCQNAQNVLIRYGRVKDMEKPEIAY